MAAPYPQAYLAELRSALTVLQVVQRHHEMRKAGGAEYKAVDDASIGVNTAKNVWRDFGKGDKGGDIFDFEMFETGCSFQEAVERLAQVAGIPLPRGYGGSPRGPARPKNDAEADGPLGPEPPPPEPGQQPAGQPRAPRRQITATYDYRNADETLVYQVCRQEWIGDDGKRHKTFIQRRPHGPIEPRPEDQRWVWGLGAGVFLRGRDGNYYAATKERLETWAGAERIEIEDPCPHTLYRLPELRDEMVEDESERHAVFLCEGEKDCDTLHGWGLVATTNSGGAKHWREEFSEEMRDADVIVLLDNDPAGRARGHLIALSLRGVARSVRALDWAAHWTGCPEKGDVTDWRDKAGGTPERLFQIVDKLPPWSPPMPETAFNAVRFADIDRQATRLQWTIKNILQRSTVSLWYGAPSSGKSFLLTDAALSVARGVPWMGYRTRVGGLVVYQTGEGGVGFRLRLKAYRAAMRIPADVDVPFIYLPMRINLFQADADVDKMIAELQAWAAFYNLPLELVAIDTFNAASGGANENANQDVGKVLDRCRKIADVTGAHVAVVHHTPAAGGKPRGHSSLVGDVETTIAVEVTEGIDTEETTDGRTISRSARTWTLTKQKDGPSGIGRSFVLKQVKLGTKDEDDEEEDTSCIVGPLQAAVEAARRAVPAGWTQLNPANQDIFRSLVRALKTKGRAPPPEIGAPNGTEAVTVAEWRQDMLDQLIGHQEITQTVRNTYKQKIYRAAKGWVDGGGGAWLIVKKGDWVWRTSRRVHMIDRDRAPVAAQRPEQPPLLAPGEEPGLPWK